MPFSGGSTATRATCARDVIGGHRLDERRREPNRVAVGGRVRDAVHELEELRRVDDRVRDRRSPRSAPPGRASRGSSRSPSGGRCRRPTAPRDVPTPAAASAARRLRDDVWKKCITASSSQSGELETSTTTDAPTRTSARPSPVTVLTPVFGDAGTASCPCSSSLVTSLDPMRPVPPITTIFMTCLSVVCYGACRISERDSRSLGPRHGQQGRGYREERTSVRSARSAGSAGARGARRGPTSRTAGGPATASTKKISNAAGPIPRASRCHGSSGRCGRPKRRSCRSVSRSPSSSRSSEPRACVFMTDISRLASGSR